MGDQNYSQKNPFGPYASRQRPNQKGKQQSYIEGASSKKNLSQWAEYASRDSLPTKGKSKRA